MTKKLWALTVVAIMLACTVVVASWTASLYNRTISLENQFTAAVQDREMAYDNMSKQIREKISVAKFERSTIVELVDNVVAGRDGGQLFKMVHEQYPDLTPQLFQEVMATIGGKRDEFTRKQQVLAQLQKEHKDMLTQLPSSFIVGNRPALAFSVISSSDAKAVMATGIDDDVISMEEK